MNGTQVLVSALKSTHHLVNWFIADLSDADLLVRPVVGANHIAWQLGHLIASERGLAKQIPGTVYPALPDGFEARHTKDTSALDVGFLTKAEYVAQLDATRAATIAAIERLTDADLDTATAGPMVAFAPNLGALTLLVANHVMMHAGQFTTVRRKLGKPVLF